MIKVLILGVVGLLVNGCATVPSSKEVSQVDQIIRCANERKNELDDSCSKKFAKFVYVGEVESVKQGVLSPRISVNFGYRYSVICTNDKSKKFYQKAKTLGKGDWVKVRGVPERVNKAYGATWINLEKCKVAKAKSPEPEIEVEVED